MKTSVRLRNERGKRREERREWDAKDRDTNIEPARCLFCTKEEEEEKQERRSMRQFDESLTRLETRWDKRY